MDSVMTTNLKEQIDSGIIDFKSGVKLKSYFDSIAEFHGHSYGNVILIKNQSPEAKFISTPETWYNRFGRLVKDKSQGIIILVPDTLKKTVVKARRDEKGNYVLDESKRIIETKNEFTIPYMKPIAVYDVTRTEGKHFNLERNFDASSVQILQGVSDEIKNMSGYEWMVLNKDRTKAAVIEAVSHIACNYFNMQSESDLSKTRDWIYGKDISEIKCFLEIVQRKSYNAIENINYQRSKMNELGGKKYAEHSLNI